MIEKLTDAERASLAATDQTTLQGRSGTKALRVLDAHAAGVAALVQDRDEWQQVSRDWRYRAETAEAELRQQKEDRAALVAQLEAANGLLARTQGGSPMRPRVACSDQVQLDYYIGQHLQRQGWQWDAFQRKWRSPGTAETATWTEYRGREQ